MVFDGLSWRARAGFAGFRSRWKMAATAVALAALGACESGSRKQGLELSTEQSRQALSVVQRPVLKASDGAAGDVFGVSVSMAPSGTRALVGALGSQTARGSAYIYDRQSDGSWTELVPRLRASDGVSGDQFGVAVSLSGDRALIGASRDNSARGAAYVFDRQSDGTWLQTAKITAPDAAANDQFGASVSLSGDRAVIGALLDDDGGTDSGSVSLFERQSDGTWLRQAKLVAGDPAANDHFGASVSVSGDRVVVGADFDDDGGTNTGSVYVFERDGATGTWPQRAKLHAATPATNGHFGVSVSLLADRALIGAFLSGGPVGSAYVFDRSDAGTWPATETARLTVTGISIGGSVSLGTDLALVGASSESSNAGAAYLFTRQGGTWVMPATRLAPSDTAVRQFGGSVSLGGGRAIIGAPADTNNKGAAYVFDIAAGGQGDPCNTADDCSTGFCVDGVCCESACNGGHTNGCTACSPAFGGTTPGICSPINDSDGDGVGGTCDACPNDPAKVTPGACGCGVPDTDSDGDGTPNCLDGCPNDPGKVAPGVCGCGVPDTDNDGDGIPNCLDACPNDPGKVAPGVCGCGVPDTDNDGDGIPNCLDACPNDPGKVAPGACGCGVPDTDSDGDGTPNCLDACPTDPGKVAPGACGCGVPDTDNDGDGIPNCLDACPNDPGKVAPGACGCGVPDTDNDGDGTPNCLDACPTDPGKVAPGACGCGVPDTDSDGDGTPNCLDGCPNDPGKTEPGVCECGNPDPPSGGNTPLVTPPSNRTVNTCRPPASALGTATATDPCGLPVDTPTSDFTGFLPRGPNTVVWSATDSAGRTGTANQTVTVDDQTAPTLVVPANVQVSSCSSGNVTVGTPTATDDCGSVTVTGQVITANGVTLNPPINVVGGQAPLGFGTFTVRWTASDGINTSTADQTVVVSSRIQARESFILDDRGVVQNASGGGASVLNSGTGTTTIGVEARSGNIFSVAAVNVLDRATVSGSILSAGNITISPTATVGTPVTRFTQVSLPALPALPSFPPVNRGSITVNPPPPGGGPTSLLVGSYQTVILNSGAKVVLAAGDYFFRSLTINNDVRVQVTPTTRIFVMGTLVFQSPLVNAGGAVQSSFLGFAGSGSLIMAAPFDGTLLAPNSAVQFGIASGLTFHGSFFGRVLQVRNQSVLVCQ